MELKSSKSSKTTRVKLYNNICMKIQLSYLDLNNLKQPPFTGNLALAGICSVFCICCNVLQNEGWLIKSEVLFLKEKMEKMENITLCVWKYDYNI